VLFAETVNANRALFGINVLTSLGLPEMIVGNVEVKVWFVQYVGQRARAHTALVCAAHAHTRGIK